MELVAIAPSHAAQRSTPPVSSQKRRPQLETFSLSLMACLAASTHSLGMPGSGTGTPIHSSHGTSTLFLTRGYVLLPSLTRTSRVCVALLAVPRDAVIRRGVERGGDLATHYFGDLFVAVPEVHITQNELSERRPVPSASPSRRRYTFCLQPRAHGVQGHTLNSHHPENAPDQGHPELVYFVAVPSLVVAKSVV